MSHEIEDYLPFAAKLAFEVAAQVPEFFRDDLRAAAFLGLWEAWLKFDPDKGYHFLTFARRRIYGACIDELRRWLKRHNPHGITFHSLDALKERGQQNGDLSEPWEPADSAAQFDFERLEAELSLDPALSTLTPRARYIVDQTLVSDERTLQSLGDELGLHESRISQIRTEAIHQLRKELAIA